MTSFSGGRRRPSHRPPAPDCMCGIYALADPEDRRLHGWDDQIVGAITAWGDIELHRTGFRAEQAEVVALAGEGAAAEAAARRYGVPLVERAQLPVVAREHGRPIEPGLVGVEPTQQDRERHVGEVGYAHLEHVWCVPRSA